MRRVILPRFNRGSRTAAALALLAAALAGCATPARREAPPPAPVVASGIAYQVTLVGIPDPAIRSVLEDSLRLYTLRARPPASVARLRRRVDADLATARGVLHASGHFDATVSAEIDAPAGAPAASVQLRVEPGARYRIGSVHLEPRMPAPGLEFPSAAALGLATGAVAEARAVTDLEQHALQWLHEHGFPFAQVAPRDAVLDPARQHLDLTIRLEPGPRARFGEVSFEGLRRVETSYLRSYLPWTADEYYALGQVEALRRALTGTGLFTFVTAEARPVTAGAGGLPRVPIVVRVAEAKRRTVTAGVRYSTDSGPGARGRLEHRNLFGANETAQVTAIAALSQQELAFAYTRPQYRRARQSLVAGLAVHRETDEAFDELALDLHLGLRRDIGSRLRVSVGSALELADIQGSNREGKSLLFGVPVSATYDASDDLLDPTTGLRAEASLTPYAGTFDHHPLLFSVVDLGGSWYHPLATGGKHVVAARARLGSIFGAERDALPANKRLYSGGGGSVRGYEARFIGPLDDLGDPIGGRSVAELGVELRSRITPTLGLVPFVGAGTVSDALFPDFDRGVQFAAGLGVRYYTAIGPLRADFAMPLNPRPSDAAFQFYLSIGQSF